MVNGSPAKNGIVILASVLCLGGCGTMITVPIDSRPLSEEKATLIVYHEQGAVDEFKVVLDQQFLGHVTSEKPLKIVVEPGRHDLYVDLEGIVIRRITTQNFEKGKVQYMKIWLDLGMWVSSIRIDPTPEVESYRVRSRRQ
jgi:hypothetical protein